MMHQPERPSLPCRIAARGRSGRSAMLPYPPHEQAYCTTQWISGKDQNPLRFEGNRQPEISQKEEHPSSQLGPVWPNVDPLLICRAHHCRVHDGHHLG